MDANPYASLPAVEPGPPADEHIASAGRMRRLAATTLDLAITAIACFMALVFIFIFEDLSGRKLGAMFDPIAAGTFLLVVSVLHLPMLASGRTMGKKLLGLRITRRDGSPAGPARLLFLRHGPHVLGLLIILLFLAGNDARDTSPLGLLLLFPLCLPLGWLLIFREDRRTLFDLLADTKVVRA